MVLDADSATALYAQISRLIADEVSGGVLQRGDRLPSERDLCQRFGVSRVTLRRALADLVRQGVVESSRGRGWFVTTGVLGEPPNALQSFTETAAARGLRATARVLEATGRPATLEDAEQLAIVPGAPLFHLRRVRLLGGLPIAFDHSRVPLELAPELEQADFAVASLYAVLQAAGLSPSRADYQVQAAAADASAAALLDARAGDPVLVTEQVTYDIDGRPIELTTMTYRGDRYRFRASLGRTTRRETA
jgi:DNA-binding GntR family transcriptional regulator